MADPNDPYRNPQDSQREHDDDVRRRASPQRDPGHSLPWPEGSDSARLGERFEHGASPEQRELGKGFERSKEASEHELGRQFADPNFAGDRRLGNAFADPNSADDGRVGRSFEEANFSGKKRKPPLTERVHKPANRRPLYLVLLGLACLFLLVVLAGWLMRRPDKKATQQDAERQRHAKPVVEVAPVRRSKEGAGLVVPGTAIPLTEAYVYARANGYLKTRLVDIGDHVRKNQLLAVIDAPDLDQQVDQAREQVRQAEQQVQQQKTQLALATVTVERYRVLVTKGVFSRQEGDQREATYQSEQANVAAAQRNVDAYKANLRRTIALQQFEYVRAPFDGVVTTRNVDVGALISAAGSSGGMQSMPAPQGQSSATGGSQQAGQSNNAGSSGNTNSSATSSQSPGQGGPLFGIADVRRLRILVSVPEGYATAIHTGAHAQLAFQEYSGLPFLGDVTRTANSVDPNTRTMLTEVQVDNSERKLVPGMYVVATFPPAAGAATPLLISGDAVVIRHDTTMVATVANDRIRMVPVVIGRDYGTAIEIVNGLREGDMVVTDVTDDVVDGAEVKIHATQSPEDKPQAPPRQNVPIGGDTQYGNQGITDRNLQGQQQQQNGKGGSGQGKGNGNNGNNGKSGQSGSKQ